MTVENEINIIPEFDDIVFEHRNKEYGAYSIRKKYNRTMMWAFIIGTAIVASAIITPYVMATVNQGRIKREENAVVAVMEKLDQPQNEVAPPPPPPPPPAEVQQQVKFTAPVVVDSVKATEVTQLMTSDEVVEQTVDEDVNVVQEQEEVQEEEAPQEVFLIVEEMPVFPGGDGELRSYLAKNTVYPEIAKENNIQGKVFVRFCVTYKGAIDQVSVVRGVDPVLDEEAMRVVKSLPAFKPGKQRGKPVNVWYTVPINFTLQ